MNRKTLRTAIALMTIFTAVVHAVVLNADLGKLDPLFTLNGVGWAVLLAAFLSGEAIKAQFEKRQMSPTAYTTFSVILHLAYMGFAIATIVAFFAFNGPSYNTATLGYITKAVEALLVVALYLHLQLD